jgi:hypothetical protein
MRAAVRGEQMMVLKVIYSLKIEKQKLNGLYVQRERPRTILLIHP